MPLAVYPKGYGSRWSITPSVSNPFGGLNFQKTAAQSLVEELSAGEFQVAGKGVFKEEFVTCGGVALKEVNFRTMESRVCPGSLFCG